MIDVETEHNFDFDSLIANIRKEKRENKKKRNEDNMELCSDCGTTTLIEQYGKYICKTCGLFNGDVIDQKQEWRYYGSEDNKNADPSRCGIPTNELLPNSSIGSVIGFGNNESHMMRRIRNMQYWNTIPYRESSLLESFNNISVMSQNAGISSCIIEEAKYMYKKVSELKTSGRTKKEAMKAASVYMACQIKDVPRSCKEIADMFNIKDVKVMSKAIKKFDEIWNSIKNKENRERDIIEESEDEEEKKEDAIHESQQYLHRYCSKLDINDEIYNVCYKLVTFVENQKILETHNPLSRIASCLYYIIYKYNLENNKSNIIEICDVSGVTIDKCYNKLSKYNQEINNYL